LIVFFEFKFGTGSILKFFKFFKSTWQQINISRKKAAQKIFVSNGQPVQNQQQQPVWQRRTIYLRFVPG